MTQKIQTGLVLVFGNFNVIHPGHLRLFRFARECGDKLVVGVHSDAFAGNAALVNENDRLAGVKANKYVDDAFIMSELPEAVIKQLRPSVVVKGKEHEMASNPELEALKVYGGKLVFSSGESFLSSAELLENALGEEKQSKGMIGANYLLRHKIGSAFLQEFVAGFSNKRVCVVGDLIVDEYVSCESEGISREEPVMVVAPSAEKKFVGGAGIVAAHAAGLGAQVNYYGVRGRDKTGEFAAGELKEMGVESLLIEDTSRPSILKRRYRVGNKSLLRVNRFRKHAISRAIQDEILSAIEPRLADSDLLVLADFNYGLLPEEFVNALISKARHHEVMIAADSQCSSQLGNVARFRNVDLLTPTEHEARVSLHDPDSGLVVLAEHLRQQTKVLHVLLTLNKEGLLIHAGPNDSWETDRLPAFCANPVDASGAGDCLMITTALALCSGSTIWQAAFIGSVAAGVQVSRLGNRPITQEELQTELGLYQ